jgi:hypothetical protein
VHDIFVAHVMLECSGIVPVVGKLVAGGVAKHVREGPDSHGMSGAADRRAQELWQICHMP